DAIGAAATADLVVQHSSRDTRQLEVEDDDVGTRLIEIVKCIEAVFTRVNGEIRETQGHAVEIAQHLIVLDDQEEGTSGHRGSNGTSFNNCSIPIPMAPIGLESQPEPQL